MTSGLAAIDQNYAMLGLIPAGAIVVGFIVNFSSRRSRDMNFKSGLATNGLFTALLIEVAAWMIATSGGGTKTGIFWTLVVCGFLHVASALVAFWACFEFRTMGRWPHGRRRAFAGFWLNLLMLLMLSALFYLYTDEKLSNRVFL